MHGTLVRPIEAAVRRSPRRWLTALAAAAAAAGLGTAGTFAAEPARPHGIDMIYVDAELAPRGGGRQASARRAVHPIYRELSDGLAQYRSRWGSLPQTEVPAGPVLRPGASGERVRLLRERLGLDPQGGYDAALTQAVRTWQGAHGLPVDGIAGGATLASLNRGAAYYERLIEANLERARALPANPGRRYILIDAAAAKLWMYENGRPVDSMRVIVGRPGEETPMLAAYVRHAVLNPYWNVPPDLVQRRIAPVVLQRGMSYLRDQGYEVLSGWGEDAERVDPATIDWRAVAAGRREVRMRQLPGPANGMGEIKFMLSDRLGIFLHDTPDRSLFGQDDRRLSAGCVRLEDARRLARWLFGRPISAPSGTPERRVDLAEPVPAFITYLTAAPGEDGIVFREDIYGRDAPLLARLETTPPRLGYQALASMQD